MSLSIRSFIHAATPHHCSRLFKHFSSRTPCRFFSYSPVAGPKTKELTEAIAQINKWQVAKLFAEDSSIPIEVFQGIFTDIIKILEKTMKLTFSPALKHRIWTSVSSHPVEVLREKLTQEVNAKILKGYPDHKISKIFHKHVQTGSFAPHHIEELYTTSEPLRQSIQCCVTEKALLMRPIWNLEIKKAFRKEGVVLPDKI